MTTEYALKRIRRLELDAEERGDLPVHNVNELYGDSLTVGQEVADSVARNMGSWRFIVIQSITLLAWVIANAALAFHNYLISGFNLRAWDPYPFILLNLVLSFQAAYSAPIIMMSQNRQADKDRIAAEHDYHVNIRAEATVRATLEHLKAQDDVILSILRQMERVHSLTPNDHQRACEARLQEVRVSEERLLRASIRAAEVGAGLE
jgi:uncharacterized membrane protein